MVKLNRTQDFFSLIGKMGRLNNNNRGITLIELCVALSMVAIVLVLIFTSWTNFSTHVIKQRRKGMLNAEIDQISKVLVSGIRRSDGLLAWHSSGITYVTRNNSDTIVYEFYGDHLLKNDNPIAIISQRAHISDFIIEEVEQGVENEDMILLSISITIEDDFDNQVVVASNIATEVLVSDDDDDDDFNKWDF